MAWKDIQWQSMVDPSTGVRIYRLAGFLSDSERSFALLEQVRSDMRLEPHPALLDLTGIEPLTSSGVGIIAAIYTSGQNATMDLALMGLNARSRLILQLVGLLRLIRAFDAEQDALAAHADGGWKVPG